MPPAPDIDPDEDDEVSHVEYHSPGGGLWRVEDALLLAEFEITPDLLPVWHAKLTGQGRIWEIVCKYFGVFPVIGAPADAGQWMPDDIAKHYGISFAAVEEEMDQARHYWRMARGAIALTGAPKGDEEKERAEPPSDPLRGINRSHAESLKLTDPEIDRILESNGFADLVDHTERRLTAIRLIDLDHLLAEPESRPMVAQAVRQELDLAYLNRALSEERANSKSGATTAKKVEELIAKRDKLQEAYGKTMEQLGATQAQKSSAQKRVDFQDCIGYLTLAAQQYYADGSRVLIDGMHTAAEVNFLLTPVLERPCQYDPQTVIEVYLAQQTLWDKEFEGNRLNRATSRRLRALFRDSYEAMIGDAGIAPRRLEDDSADDEDIELDERERLAAQENALPGSPLAAPDQATPAFETARIAGQVRRAAEDVVACG